MSNSLTHLDEKGNAKMVDVGPKVLNKRTAIAEGFVDVGGEVMKQLQDTDFVNKKGSVTGVARIAGIMGAKKTAELIPLCHPLGLDKCDIDIEIIDNQSFKITCSVSVDAKTGVEMEALTGVSIAALTLYDMCKALSREILIRDIRLVEKRGGKSDYQR